MPPSLLTPRGARKGGMKTARGACLWRKSSYYNIVDRRARFGRVAVLFALFRSTGKSAAGGSETGGKGVKRAPGTELLPAPEKAVYFASTSASPAVRKKSRISSRQRV